MESQFFIKNTGIVDYQNYQTINYQKNVFDIHQNLKTINYQISMKFVMSD
jgi:hypothetical protein